VGRGNKRKGIGEFNTGKILRSPHSLSYVQKMLENCARKSLFPLKVKPRSGSRGRGSFGTVIARTQVRCREALEENFSLFRMRERKSA